MLKLQDKKMIVEKISSYATLSLSAAIADYSGLSVNKINILRHEARKSNIYLKVVRNNLIKLAFEKTKFECANSVLKGPIIIAFSKEDPGKLARLFKKFVQDNKSLIVKSIIINGEMFTSDRLEEISKIPSKEDSISLLCNSFNAPIRSIVNVLKQTLNSLIFVLLNINTKK